MKRSKSVGPASGHIAARPDPLRASFQHTVDLLSKRRADLLPATMIEAYVDCDWLTWRGGSLKLTVVGENICAQLRNESRRLAMA
jgi:hypothetical protein